MRLYNTKSGKVEEFKPLKPGEVSMYVCGPTVYNDIHIGNARPIVVFDTLRRTFEELGYKVKYVSNYTDVDDKIIAEAQKKGISEASLTEEMIKRVEKIREALNAEDLYRTPKVTETMPEIIDFIDRLVAKGAAYEKDGDVFFKTTAVKSYGELSHQKMDDLKVGARIEENEKKESALDFVLWKKTEQGIRWPSRYSLGRPGWHTECVVMINKELGPLIDIHGGGKDLRFPHHENERAQSLALNNSELANYWLHNGMIDIEGVKMSKSLGNFKTVKEALKTIDPAVLRWLLLSAHYRADLNFSAELLAEATRELTKTLQAYKQAALKLALNAITPDSKHEERYYGEFMAAMSDDLNTPNAYSALFKTVKELNQLLRQSDYAAVQPLFNSLKRMLTILGIKCPIVNVSAEDKALYQEWVEYKKAHDYVMADKLREVLQKKGLF